MKTFYIKHQISTLSPSHTPLWRIDLLVVEKIFKTKFTCFIIRTSPHDCFSILPSFEFTGSKNGDEDRCLRSFSVSD